MGDSFADALAQELNKLFKAADLRPTTETKTPSYVENWAYNDDLPRLLAKSRPDLVLITLGANEVDIPDPLQRAKAVKRIAERVGDRPCVWILPPLWKQDTGLMQVIKDNASPCKILDSNALVKDLPRGPDHIHPSTEGRRTWANAVFEWLKRRRVPGGPKPWTLSDSEAP